MTDPLSLIPQSSFVKHNDGKFAPKLSEDERCAVLALVKSGIRRDVVAEAFSLDKRTVGHIANDASGRYKTVRAKYKNEGHDEFIAKYLTEDVARRVAAVDLPAAEKPVPAPNGVSRRADRLAGVHKIDPAPGLREYPHEVEIKFMAGNEEMPDGWYYRHLTSKTDTESWLHFGDESRKTSSACLQAVMENLFDT